jgi:hypothetical protein
MVAAETQGDVATHPSPRSRAGIAWLRATPRRVWWTSFGLLFAIALVWTFTTPPLGSGDEHAHVVRAHALADGDWIGESHAGQPEQNRYVEVPAIYVYVTRSNLCFVYDTKIAVSCSRFSGPLRDVEISTVAGRYPPAYYAVIGFGSKFLDPLARADLMRVISAAMCAALLASAVVTLRRLRHAMLAMTGLAVAITPTALYMFGVVNPSALETAAGIALWVSGTVLFSSPASTARGEPTDDDPRDRAATSGAATEIDGRLVARTGIAALALVLSRPASPFWLLLIGVALLVLSNRARIRALVADRRIRVWSVVVLLTTIAQTAWILIVKPLDQHFPQFGIQGGFGNSVKAAIGETYPNYVEMIGSLGFMNEPVPNGVIVLWTAAIAALVMLAFLFARRAVAWVVGGLIVVILVVPTAIQAIQAADAGLYWQGRFVLPLATGIPIIAAIGLAQRVDAPGLGALQKLVPFVAGVFVVGQVISYGQQLRRWTVGSRGTLLFFVDWDWSRAAPPWFLLAAFVVLTVMLTAWLLAPDRSSAPTASASVA